MLKRLFVIWTLLSAAPVNAGDPNYPDNPLLFDGALYRAHDGLARFDIGRMEERWRTLDGIQIVEPVAAGDRILVGSSRGLYALNPADGRILWHIPAKQLLYSPAVASGVAYFGGRDGKLRAVAVSDGNELWSRRLPGDWVYSPTLSGRILITGGQGSRLWGIDMVSGEIRWQAALDQELVFSPVSDENGRVYLSTFSGRLSALDGSSGATLWTRSLPVTGSIPTPHHNQLYVPGLDGVLRAVAADSGKLLWESRLGSRISGPPLVKQGKLLIVTDDDRFLLLDTVSGELLYDTPLEGVPVAGAVLHGHHLMVPLISGVSKTAVARINIIQIEGIN